MSSGWFLTKQNFADMDRIIQQHRKNNKNRNDFRKRKLFVHSSKPKKDISILSSDNDNKNSSSSLLTSDSSISLTPETATTKPFSTSLSPIKSITKKPNINFIESAIENLTISTPEAPDEKTSKFLTPENKKTSFSESPSPIPQSVRKNKLNLIESTNSEKSSILTPDNTKSPSPIKSTVKKNLNFIKSSSDEKSSILTSQLSLTPIKSTSKKKINFIASTSESLSSIEKICVIESSSDEQSSILTSDSESPSLIKSTGKKKLNFINSSSSSSSSSNSNPSFLTPQNNDTKSSIKSTTKKIPETPSLSRIKSTGKKSMATTPSSTTTLKTPASKSSFPRFSDANFSSRKRIGLDNFRELRRRLNDICDSDSGKSLSGNESDNSETDSDDDNDCTKSLFSFYDSNSSTDRSWLNGFTCKYSFLESLSNYVTRDNADPEAYEFRINFKTKRSELCSKLFALYNREVFDDKLSENLPIEWSARLTGTAGHCWTLRREKMRFCRITLSNKVVDSADRLRDTLIHEMCHAAVFLIDNRCDGHGLYWKRWTSRAMLKFPELPPIRKCHNYAILKKFTYKCQECGYSIGRHSKSIDTKGQRCGLCHGKLLLFTNKKTKDGIVSTPFVERKLNEFAQYVKDNYAIVKQSCAYNENVMRILSYQFAEIKSKAAAAEAEAATTPAPKDT